MNPMIEPIFYDYANAAWKKDVKTAAKNLTKIYEKGVSSPFRTNIILHDMPKITKPDCKPFELLLKMRGFFKTMMKADGMPEVQPAKEKFIDTIKESYPLTAPLRQMLIDYHRFSVDKVLPKASQEEKLAIKFKLDEKYTKAEKDKLMKMWDERWQEV